MQCRYPGCNRKNGIKNGRCRTHQGCLQPPSPLKSPCAASIKNEAIKNSLDHLNEMVLQLQTENLALNHQLDDLQDFAKHQKKLNRKLIDDNLELREENNLLRSKVNKANYNSDSVEQYTRKENIKLVDVDEKDNETDKDVMNAVIDRANYALSKSKFYKDTKVQPSDIQRVHRVGRKREAAQGSNTPLKPRKIICRFKFWALRQKFIKSKKALKGNPDFNGSFITEDLTQFRSKLLWFVKKKCGGKFVNCHTRNGEIYAQLKDAQGDDDDFITIKSPEDLFKYDIDVDFNLINDNYLRFSVLEPLDTISVKNSFEQLLEAVQVPT